MLRHFVTINFYFLLLPALIFQSCRKDNFLTDPSSKISFSTDTLTFDTVFTTLGSVTKGFKIYNPNNKPVKINARLSGGVSSQFRLNIDGIPGFVITEIEIAAKDSVYAFVEVTVNPTVQNLPFVISDSVLFELNGNLSKVILNAWGQNAHFYKGITICDMTWTNDKPYVIINSIFVDYGCTLTIEEGSRIYLNSNSAFFVGGTLKINGTLDSMVTFQGTRLESFYQDLPGQWAGIYFLRNSTNNELNFSSIRNATYGIAAGSDTTSNMATFTFANAPTLSVKNTIIKNILGSGIFGLLADIRLENTLIFNCGANDVQIELGGNYDFNHCTFANYGNPPIITHKSPVVRMSNYFKSDALYLADLNVNYTNCIIYGNQEEELDLDNNSNTLYNFLFENCLIQTKLDISNPSNYISIIKNTDPLFEEANKENYQLKIGSPAIDKGKTTSVTNDLAGKTRDILPDIGAYEWTN